MLGRTLLPLSVVRVSSDLLVSAAGIVLMAATAALPATPPTDEVIGRLIRQLGNDEFEKSEEANKELETIGEPAFAALRKAAASSDDVEIRTDP